MWGHAQVLQRTLRPGKWQDSVGLVTAAPIFSPKKILIQEGMSLSLAFCTQTHALIWEDGIALPRSELHCN